MYVAAGLLLAVNVMLGFLNVMRPAGPPRWQALFHLHSGTIGWATLAIVATTIWWFTGRRRLAPRQVRTLLVIGYGAIVSTSLLATSFAFAFGMEKGWIVLPLFGTTTAIVILSTFLYAISQMRHQAVLTASHFMLLGGLFLATVGAVMGILFGTQYALDRPYMGDISIGIHAFTMDSFVYLSALAILEPHIAPVRRAGWLGAAPAIVVPAVMIVFILFMATGVGEMATIIAFPLYLLAIVVFMGRTGWRAVLQHPFAGAREAHVFWGGVNAVIFLIILAVIPHEGAARWMVLGFMHFLFIGTFTNVVMATQMRAARPGPDRGPLAAAWVMNLGLLAFIAIAAVDGATWGAALMGLGVLLAIVLLVPRLGWRAGSSVEPTWPSRRLA